MPLSKKRMRLRKRRDRLSNPSQAQDRFDGGNTANVVKPEQVGKLDELRGLIRGIELSNSSQVQVRFDKEVQVEEAAPWYNPEIHTTGDTVRMGNPRTKEVKTVTL